MKRLYALHLSRHIRGMAKGPVNTMQPIGIVFELDTEGNQVVPDPDSVWDCLPVCYRKAFRKAGLSQIRNVPGFHWTLRGHNGKYLNTVYAIPNDV